MQVRILVGKTQNPEIYDRDVWVEILADADCTDPIGFLGLQRCHSPFLVRDQKLPPHPAALCAQGSRHSLLAVRTTARIQS